MGRPGLLLTHAKARSIFSMRILGTAYSTGSPCRPLLPRNTVHLPMVTFVGPGFRRQQKKGGGGFQLPRYFRLICGGSDETRTRDLRHCCKTNTMRRGLHPLITDAVVGHGDRKKDVKSVYLTISDAVLVREIDRLTFDHGKTEIWGQR